MTPAEILIAKRRTKRCFVAGIIIGLMTGYGLGLLMGWLQWG